MAILAAAAASRLATGHRLDSRRLRSVARTGEGVPLTGGGQLGATVLPVRRTNQRNYLTARPGANQADGRSPAKRRTAPGNASLLQLTIICRGAAQKIF